MENAHIPFRIERTRNRHSRAVYQEDTVIIRLARNLSKTQEEHHIHELLQRMKKVLLRERSRQEISPFAPLLRGETESSITLANGTQHIVQLHPGTRLRAVREPHGIWRVHISPQTDRCALHRALWNTLCAAQQEHITTLTARINADTLRVPFTNVRLRFAKTQWGSCSTRGTLTLNPALLFLPDALLRYVIIHELAHRVHTNHSARFWDLVESAVPNVTTIRAELRGYRLPSL
jgi:predicted metal-dependent hydrolase